ncbi:MAG: hypothetical protein LBP61_01555 [Desulfovibrio sp.]|jgi:hypothetical protein|nr:hypothetical protein [Desulfovibrio sp.]
MSQVSLFDSAPSAGTTAGLAGVMPAVRAIMNRVAGEYEPGRKMLADAISAVARREGISLTPKGGKNLTPDQLDKFLQPGDREHEPTLKFILCFCLATCDYSALEPLWKTFRLVLIPADEVRFLEFGKSCDALKKAKEHHQKMRSRL